jgi:hypothetical protein
MPCAEELLAAGVNPVVAAQATAASAAAINQHPAGGGDTALAAAFSMHTHPQPPPPRLGASSSPLPNRIAYPAPDILTPSPMDPRVVQRQLTSSASSTRSTPSPPLVASAPLAELDAGLAAGVLVGELSPTRKHSSAAAAAAVMAYDELCES